MAENKRYFDWDKFCYNAYMILTFPVRKWWIILSVLATVLMVLIIIPTIEGIKKEDIVDWYKAKWTYSDVNKAKNKTIAMMSRKLKSLKKNVEEIMPDGEQKKSAAENQKKSEFVAWNVAEFRKVKYVPKGQNAKEKVYDGNTFALIKEHIKKKQKKKIKPVEADVIKPAALDVAKSEIVDEENLSDYYEIRTDLDLEYLNEPEEIVGTATISGANDLYIEDTFVYLYGIYSNPRTYNINEARDFLEAVTNQQQVECDVVAYSTQTHAKTALCFVNGVLINKQMVIENLAENVALKMD